MDHALHWVPKCSAALDPELDALWSATGVCRIVVDGAHLQLWGAGGVGVGGGCLWLYGLALLSKPLGSQQPAGVRGWLVG